VCRGVRQNLRGNRSSNGVNIVENLIESFDLLEESNQVGACSSFRYKCLSGTGVMLRKNFVLLLFF
jgi:hypothetical protein